MQLLKLLLLPLAIAITTTLASPTPLTKRDSTTVTTAITTISSQLVRLNSTVSTYHGGLLGTLTALHIQLESSALASDLQRAVFAAQQSANFSAGGSYAVSDAVLTLMPQIKSALQTIVAKKTDFQTGLLGVLSLDFLVRDDLVLQARLSAELGSELATKLAPPFSDFAPVINAEIAKDFKAAIDAFE